MKGRLGKVMQRHGVAARLYGAELGRAAKLAVRRLLHLVEQRSGHSGVTVAASTRRWLLEAMGLSVCDIHQFSLANTFCLARLASSVALCCV